ncbi:MAG: hypothetical protein HQK49_18475 [Oligoflexia bacterium]|nr:hypothetical protein [Oligoflexia bacterium]
MSKNSNIECKNWIPISNSIYKNFYREHDSSAMSVLFKIIARIHNYKDKTYTKFSSLADACTYFDISKKPLLRELDKLQNANLIEYEYHRHGHIEIEVVEYFFCPSNCVTTFYKLKKEMFGWRIF